MLKKVFTSFIAAAIVFTMLPVAVAVNVLSSFTLTPSVAGDSTFDPSPLGTSGGPEQLNIAYAITGDTDSVSIVIKDQYNTVVKTFSHVETVGTTSETGSDVWDGKYNSKLVLPGTYTATLTAVKAGEADVTQTQNFTVAYPNAGKGELQNVVLNPTSFDPDSGDTTFSFTNTANTNVTITVREADGDMTIENFVNYNDTTYSASHRHNFIWNGKFPSTGTAVQNGSYKMFAIARNDYGVVVAEQPVSIVDTTSTISTSNAHVDGITLNPSGTFEPVEDQELEVEFDLKVDVDDLVVYAIRGTEKIEIFNEGNMDKDDNYQFFWEGTDEDDEYVSEGTWKIRFESKIGSTTLLAEKSIEIKYDKPEIDDLYLSKKKFDNEQDEFTNVLFRIDNDAIVKINILRDNVVEDELVEDMEVEKDLWYAVEWDGDGYDYEDDIDIQLIAQNSLNETIYDVETIAIDLAEDEVASSRANVTQDYITPVLTDGKMEMAVIYELSEEAEVEITIHRGESASGSTVITLVDEETQEGGSQVIEWNGKDNNGSTLTKGVYTYKIKSRLRNTEEEIGLFIIGNVGGVEGRADGSDVGGGDDDVDGEPTGNCGGFRDVVSTSKYCDAIEFVKNKGIFQGYPDGRFGQFDFINRAEILKVILEANGIEGSTNVFGNLGFIDVVVGEWYMPYISIAKGMGIFQGDAGMNTARPDSPVNRVEALKLVFETLRVSQGYRIQPCTFSYPDAPVGVWYSQYACASKQYDLFEAFGGINLGSASYATRGEMALLFYKLSQAGVI